MQIFEKLEKKRILPNQFQGDNITVILKPNKDKRRKIHMNFRKKCFIWTNVGGYDMEIIVLKI